tara:strand:+ start:482 stop:625 length:144 start_codon:yes stop_codon:yes gene_type:complete
MKNKIRKFTHYVILTYAFSLAALATFGVGYCLYAIIFLGAKVNFLIG